MTAVLSDLTLNAIQAEATSAYLRHGEHSMLGPKTDDRRLAILAEEIGEVARELNDAEIEGRPIDRDKLVKELIQAGAMCASWVEALEGRAARAALDVPRCGECGRYPIDHRDGGCIYPRGGQS